MKEVVLTILCFEMIVILIFMCLVWFSDKKK
jgi:hypothetical protein